MRMLWNIISFLAVVHLLALAMVLAWMWQSGRLTAERFTEVRDLFALSVADAQADDARLAAEEQAKVEQAVLQEREAHPPADSATQITQLSTVRRQEEQTRRRLLDDKSVLLEQLAAATLRLNDQQAALSNDRQGWENAVQADRQRKNDEQFQQTVRQYEQVPARQGKRMLMELVGDNQIEQAVAYLDAMSPRAATKIIREFKTESEIALATELLERLRTFGIQAPSDPTAGSLANGSNPSITADPGLPAP